MDVRLLIDALVRETAGLIADLATVGGSRTLVADVPDRMFHALAAALEARGLSKKLVADMCGLALRGYQKRMQRLAESATVGGRTLWEAVLAFLHERDVVPRADLEARFQRDDPETLGSVLHDLVEGGLVFKTGSGASAAYRATRESELRGLGQAPDGEAAEALVWLSIYRGGPDGRDGRDGAIAREALAERHAILGAAALDAVLERLVASGRVALGPDGGYRCHTVVMPIGQRAGIEAALIDHLQAVFATVRAAVERRSEPWTGGSTYRLDLAPDGAHADAVRALLPRLRAELGSLRAETDAMLERGPDGPSEAARQRVSIYVGVSVAPSGVETRDRSRDEEEA
ncbi:MAG: hypothetical protein U1F43_26135 [Myxococcota bacterium]